MGVLTTIWSEHYLDLESSDLKNASLYTCRHILIRRTRDCDGGGGDDSRLKQRRVRVRIREGREWYLGQKKITMNGPFSFSFSREWVFSRFEPARQRHGPIPTEGWSSLLIYRDSWFDSTGKYLYWPIVHCKKHIYRLLICWLAIPTNGSTLLVYL